jgi:hypothetical protein
VSNPVAPPPPPPASEGLGDAPAQEGLGDAPAPPGPVGEAPVGEAPAAPVKKKSGVGKILLGVGAALVALIVVFVVKGAFLGDKAKDAAVGDCIASSKKVTGTESTEAEAKVVDCGSADAAFSVVGRVNGETDTNSKSCDKFFKENEQFFVYSSTASGGYLLCLKPKS